MKVFEPERLLRSEIRLLVDLQKLEIQPNTHSCLNGFMEGMKAFSAMLLHLQAEYSIEKQDAVQSKTFVLSYNSALSL